MLPQSLELPDAVILLCVVGLFAMKLAADALAARLTSMVVQRLSDGTHWAPADDAPYHPIDGFNFVPASKCRPFGFGPMVWVKQATGESWIVADPSLFEIVVPSQLGLVGQQ